MTREKALILSNSARRRARIDDRAPDAAVVDLRCQLQGRGIGNASNRLGGRASKVRAKRLAPTGGPLPT
jgi:hypothetical protein